MDAAVAITRGRRTELGSLPVLTQIRCPWEGVSQRSSRASGVKPAGSGSKDPCRDDATQGPHQG